MQATYCDICGERIRTKGVRKEVPIYYTDGIRWIESDICNNCVESLAQCCSKLKEEGASK